MNYPLTSAQQVFNTENITGNLPVWNNAFAVVFNGYKTKDELSVIVNDLIKENDAFRLVFLKDEHGTAYQKFAEFERKNVEHLGFQDEDELDNFLTDVVNRPLQIFDHPLAFYTFEMRDRFGIILHIHHILCDGFCAPLLAEKIKNKLSDNYTDGKVFSYEKQIIKDLDFKKSKAFEKRLLYWDNLLNCKYNNVIFDNNFFNDYSSSNQKYNFSHETIKKAKALCEGKNVPFSCLSYVLFIVYVFKTFGLSDFSIGTPIHNRLTNDEMNTIGLYMHILPLVSHIKPTDTFYSVLESTYDSVVELIRNQKVTQFDIRNHCTSAKTEQVLFDTSVDFQPDYYDTECEIKTVYSNSVSVPMEIHFFEKRNDELCVYIRYRNKMFRHQDIRQMFTSFERILEEFVDNPNKLIINADFSEERLSSENTNGENLSILHGDIIDFDRSATLFSLFEKRVFENKEKICIQDNDADISFIEFYNSVCRTDAAIREKTKGRKQVIGVFAERSVEMYVAIYAIIRGGNAYMPIAVDQPCKRTEYMMKNSGASLILCQDKLAKKINAFDTINVTKIIDDNSPFAAFSPAAQPDDIAYVIYTSGTTGNPKGAMIKHTSIVNRINWMHRKYPSDDDSVILQKTPYTFDVSVWEIFWWGIFGGKLAFSKPNEHFLPEKIADEVCRRQVTHIHFVPSVFSAFLNYIEKNNISVSRFSSMKYVFLSGEALDSSSVNRFYRLFDAYDVALHNLYGPTECAVDVTYFDCPRKPLDVIPIGKPIDNTSAYVMDSKLNPVPVGINGELYIGGANVGAGYINDEALTNMSFINSEKYGRLYKTGDLARINEAGEIIFCGRKDGQLKINGQRIEIDEIEHTIMSISEITDAVVIPRKTGEKIRLIAFYSGKELKDTEIEEKCLENLPRYMIPHRFLHLESIPVNQNGKTDRKKLEAFEIISASDAEYESPITKTEIKIADAFKKYLKTDLVGRHTDFIKSGGSSIDIINFVSEPEYRGVSVSDFISSPTPAGIADILVKNKTSHFKQLQILKYSDTAEKSVVIVPFAGASPAAFAAFAEYICNSLGASVYYLPYVGSPDPVHASANEIQELCKISDVVLYGHCIGAQLCIRIAEIIENGGTVLSGLVLAGYVPSVRNPKRNIWDFIPDTLIAKVLSKAGADFSALTNSALEEIISNFKKDTSLLQDNHISPCKKIAAPAAIILNKDDLFTKGYRYPERNYSPFLSDMNFKILDGQNHYFQTEKKEVIAQAINSFFNR